MVMNKDISEKTVKRAILFVRVSTDYQSEKSQEAQENELIDFALKDSGYMLSEFELIKPESGGESAVKLKLKERATIQKMYAVIDNPDNDIQAVYCWELSRLSRRPKDLHELKEFFQERKINLITMQNELRMFNREGKETSNFNIMFSILTAFAEDEIRLKNERTKRGKKEKSEKGYAVNGGVFFGYCKDENKKIQIDLEQSKTVALIFNLYSTGKYGILSIQRELESGGITLEGFRISKILSYRLYTGERVQGVFNRQLPQIISTEVFEQCRKVAAAKNSKANKTNRIYYAGRLIKCSDCGSYLTAGPNTHVFQYTCHHKYSKITKRQCNASDRISVNVIDSIVWHYARWKETNFIYELNEEKIIEWKSQINELQAKIDNAENQYEAIKAKKRTALKRTIKSMSDKAIEQLVIDETKDEKKRIQNDVIGYKTTIEHLNGYIAQSQKAFSWKDTIVDAGKIFSEMETMTDKERSETVHKYICEIRIKNIADAETPTKQIDIEYFDGTIDTIFYAFRQRNKDLRLYDYPLIKGQARKRYMPWNTIYINRFECSK
jgi:DNA invertase Pin-like site-specific DNA recombinase